MSKIVLLTKNLSRNKALAALLAKQFDLSLVVVEQPKSKNKINSPATFNGKIKSILINLFGKSLFDNINNYRLPYPERLIKKIEKKLKSNSDKIVSNEISLTSEWPKETEVLYTNSVNDQAISSRLQAIKPDLIIVYGTSILKKSIISTAGLGVLNAHSSILPEYRGTFAEFWQAYNNEFENSGITFHFVDEGIDTGDIIYQEKMKEVNEKTDPFRMRAMNTISIINNYPKVIKMVLDNKIDRIPQTKGKHPTFRFKDIKPEHKLALYKRLGLLNQ